MCAVGFQAKPRFTEGLAVWIEASPWNAERASGALRVADVPASELPSRELARPERMLQIGVPPNRIDVVTSNRRVDFDTAWAGAGVGRRLSEDPYVKRWC